MTFERNSKLEFSPQRSSKSFLLNLENILRFQSLSLRSGEHIRRSTSPFLSFFSSFATLRTSAFPILHSNSPTVTNGDLMVLLFWCFVSPMMNIDYSYLKRRSDFGSTCQFSNEGPTILFSTSPDNTLADNYILKNPVDKATQEGPVLSLNEINTWRAEFSERGINHDQGGWPKDLNILDEEAVLRYRKKLEREDNYIESMRTLTKPIEHAILQNNAINIYERYFDDVLKEYMTNESLSQIRNNYRDPKSSESPRTVSHISWSPVKGNFAASYCNLMYHLRSQQQSNECYIWNVEIPSSPETTFDAQDPILNLEWNPMDFNLLIAGMYNGQIALYDVRKSPGHVDITPDVVSHRDPAHSVLWINSKAGVDFFSTSADGVVKWWDCRNLSQVTDSIILDLSKAQRLLNANGASCLEYDPSIPAKYLVGTEKGQVICGNRKGASLSEKLPWVLKAHSGPIYSLMRNPAFSKMFLTVADWGARIWSEECKESAVMWIKNYKVSLTAGEWSKSRYSVFCLSRSDGYLDVWDLLLDQTGPYVSVQVTDKALTTLRMEEQGKLLIVGDDNGYCHLIQLGESLSSCVKNDKNILSAMFDREAHREKILEVRMREIRLAMKLRAQQAEESKEVTRGEDEEDEEKREYLLKVEEDYLGEVNKLMAAYKDFVNKAGEKGGGGKLQDIAEEEVPIEKT